ncbi:hypothetical protein ACFOW4_00640 [Micromonospora sp. GCM10011542]|uniref:hypothetical protein n=1 Tax=Micromonospora sp. GCM10011542 TaxID=3317337 RepID=UPI00360660F9
MTNDIEEQLTMGMRQEVAGVEFRTDVLDAATRRNGRRVAARRGAYALGVVGLAGVLAAAVTVNGPGPTAPGANPAPVASADSPRLQLASAITASQNISYRLKITAGDRDDPDAWGSAEGAWDPAAATGWLTSTEPGGAAYHQRLIDGKLYLGSTGTKTWKQEPGNGNFEYGDVLGGASGASADPQELFKALREVQAKITRTGATSYHFESTRPFDDEYATGTRGLVGDVTLDSDRRIAKVTYLSTYKGRVKPGVKSPKSGVSFDSSQRLTLELSDYGTPVRVEKPTDVIVAR